MVECNLLLKSVYKLELICYILFFSVMFSSTLFYLSPLWGLTSCLNLESIACLVMLVASRWRVCPVQAHFLRYIWMSIGQNILQIPLRLLFIKTCNCCIMLLDNNHHSQLYHILTVWIVGLGYTAEWERELLIFLVAS